MAFCDFILHPNLQKKDFVCDLSLSRLLLEDNKLFPWVFLVPRRNDIKKIIDLPWDDQIQLLKEMDIVSKVMWKLFSPSQLNVAAIGNKTDQLHVHIICRSVKDPAWPGTVWDTSFCKKYSEPEKQDLINRIKNEI